MIVTSLRSAISTGQWLAMPGGILLHLVDHLLGLGATALPPYTRPDREGKRHGRHGVVEISETQRLWGTFQVAGCQKPNRTDHIGRNE